MAFNDPLHTCIAGDHALDIQQLSVCFQIPEIEDEFFECWWNGLHAVHEPRHRIVLRIHSNIEDQSHLVPHLGPLAIGVHCCQHLDAIAYAVTYSHDYTRSNKLIASPKSEIFTMTKSSILHDNINHTNINPKSHSNATKDVHRKCCDGKRSR